MCETMNIEEEVYLQFSVNQYWLM